MLNKLGTKFKPQLRSRNRRGLAHAQYESRARAGSRADRWRTRRVLKLPRPLPFRRGVADESPFCDRYATQNRSEADRWRSNRFLKKIAQHKQKLRKCLSTSKIRTCVRCACYVKLKPAFRSLPVMAGMTVHDDRGHDGTDTSDAPQTLCRDPPATVPRWLWSPNRPKKLILHIDLNNTILISDAITTQGTVAALEYFLTTVTWGRMSRGGRVSKASINGSKCPVLIYESLVETGHNVGSRVWVVHGVIFGGELMQFV